MDEILRQIEQYLAPVLNNLNFYLAKIPPSTLLGFAWFMTSLLMFFLIIRFMKTRKKAEDDLKALRRESPVDEDYQTKEEEPADGQYEEVVLPSDAPTIIETTETEEGIVEEKVAPAEEQPVIEPESFFSRLKTGLSKTRNSFSGGLDRIFSYRKGIDDDLLEEVEELLITSDIGVKVTMDLVEKIGGKASQISSASDLKNELRTEILSIIQKEWPQGDANTPSKPHVIMVVGVNGVGKTTTIGKLAARFKEQGRKVLIVAADTFRAAAGEQLTIWAERSGAQIVKHREGADPASVAYDGVEAAMARDIDVVLVDTAGRLHTKINLMEELKKIRRIIGKKLPDAPHETLMVLDATTGQNALTQAKLFHEALGLTGIALTKLDGTAKGGIVIGICDSMQIPLHYIGVGEKINDLQEFDPEQYVEALF